MSCVAGSKISHDEMFGMPCDVFIPAATSNAIDGKVAKQLKCNFVVEAANGPTTPAGDAVLRDRGIIVCPDIYASGGGVAVSWLEWVQNLQNFRSDILQHSYTALCLCKLGCHQIAAYILDCPTGAKLCQFILQYHGQFLQTCSS